MTAQQDVSWLTSRPIAHRGLHDEPRGVHENSMAAFVAAVEAGFAIECDVRLSADGVPMVFHDSDLRRMTGENGAFSARPAAELAELPLKGGEDRVPSLESLLTVVGGRVPLVVELKGTDPKADDAFAHAVARLTTAYEGPLALMSFDPWLIEQALDLATGVPVGLTAEGTRANTLDGHRAVFDQGCSFVSYNVHHLPNAFTRWVREERRMPVISWTVRNPEEERHSFSYADQITFEGFVPQQR